MTSWKTTSLGILFLFCMYMPTGASITKLSTEEKEQLFKPDTFHSISSVKSIPIIVLLKFAEIVKDPDLKIADPGEKFQVADVVIEKGLPRRRLIFGSI